MPLRASSGRKAASRGRELSKATRTAQGATRAALKELTPQSQARVKGIGLTSTRPILSSSMDRGVGARATTPSITFPVTKGGTLTFDRSIRRTARHEVGHFAAGAPRTAQHLTFKAAGTERSGAGLKRTEGVGFLPVNRQITMAMKRAPQRRVSSSSQSRVGGDGFQTAHLKSTAATGSSAQRARSRDLMRKLGQKAKKVGVDF